MNYNITEIGSLVSREPVATAYKCPPKVDMIFVVLTLFIGIMSATAIFLNALLIRFLYRSNIFHPNVRLLLKNLAVAVFLCSLLMFLRFAIYHPLLILIGFQRMLINNTSCALLEIPFHIFSFALILSISGIGLERFSATLKKKTDSETTGRGTKITVILIWLLAASNSFAYYLYALLQPTKICYCQLSLITTHNIFSANMLIYVFLEISVLFVYWYVYYRNCKSYSDFTINTARHNLHARFQMINNMETTRTLLPVVVVHAFFNTVYLLSLTFVRHYYDTSDQVAVKVNLILIVHHLIPLEYILQPILIVRRSEHVKKIALEMVPRLSFLWGSRQAPGHQHLQVSAGAKQRRSAAWLFGGPAPQGVAAGNVVSDLSTGAASLKRRTPVSGAALDSSVVDYRMKPETHQDILEQIWAAKPMLGQSSSEGANSSVGVTSALLKKSSVKRHSLVGGQKPKLKDKRPDEIEQEPFSN